MTNFNIGNTVITPRGEGVIVDKSYTFLDGDIFLVLLTNGLQIWRTAKGLKLIREEEDAKSICNTKTN